MCIKTEYVCILTTFQSIISDVVRVRVDGEVFMVRVKEALGWAPSFIYDIPQQKEEDCDSIDQQDKVGSNCSLGDNGDNSLDPFGIYDTIAKMNEAEISKTKLDEVYCRDYGNEKEKSKKARQGQNRNCAKVSSIFPPLKVPAANATLPDGPTEFISQQVPQMYKINSLTHPPGFSNKFFMGDDNFSYGSVKKNYLNIEAEKTLELGEKIGFNMDGCY